MTTEIKISSIKVIFGTKRGNDGRNRSFARAEFNSVAEMLHYFNVLAMRNSQCPVNLTGDCVECMNAGNITMHFRGGSAVAARFVEVLKWQQKENELLQ